MTYDKINLTLLGGLLESVAWGMGLLLRPLITVKLERGGNRGLDLGKEPRLLTGGV